MSHSKSITKKTNEKMDEQSDSRTNFNRNDSSAHDSKINN